MPAFEKARAAGADGIELDVRLDRDGTVVVFHDATLDRLCGREGRIEDLTIHERQQLRVDGEPVPTLAEVLHAFGDLEVNVEIKAPRPMRTGRLVAATAKVIGDSKRAEQILVSSFDPIALVQLHQYLPDVTGAYLFGSDQLLPARKGWLGSVTGASVFHPQHTLCTPQTMRAWHSAGIPINAWTVDDPVELARLTGLGIDGVFTNDPAGILAALAG